MDHWLRSHLAPLRWCVPVVIVAVYSIVVVRHSAAQDDVEDVRVQIDIAGDDVPADEPLDRSDTSRSRSAAARDIAREEDALSVPDRTNASRSLRNSNGNLRDQPRYQRDVGGDREDFRGERRRDRQYERTRNSDVRDDDRDFRPPSRDQRYDRRPPSDHGDYNDPPRVRDRVDDDYARDPRDRRSYDRTSADREEYDDRPLRRRRGLLRDRLRERLEEARENPEEFTERVETIIRRTDQIRSVLAPPDDYRRDVYVDEAREVFGPDRPQGPLLGVTLNTRTPGRVRIARVRPNSPAERAGLQPGDEILLADGRRVSSSDLLVQYLSEVEPVEEVEIVVRRAGQELTVWADLSPHADERTDLPTDEVYQPNSTGNTDSNE